MSTHGHHATDLGLGARDAAGRRRRQHRHLRTGRRSSGLWLCRHRLCRQLVDGVHDAFFDEEAAHRRPMSLLSQHIGITTEQLLQQSHA